MEEVKQALNLLYSSPDPHLRRQADEWLIRWQQAVQAWQVCDQMLSQGESLPVPCIFFAAQTMRTKIQFDFHELPASSYSSLRESLLRHLLRFSVEPCFQMIHTQLAIAIADLAIQMGTDWEGVFNGLLTALGPTPSNHGALLEIVKMLPEESTNPKLMVEAPKRRISQVALQHAVPVVMKVMLDIHSPPSTVDEGRVLGCFLSWIRFADFAPIDLIHSPLLMDAFRAVALGSNNSEVATDVIVEALRHFVRWQYEQPEQYGPAVTACINQLAPLRERLYMTLAGRSWPLPVDEQEGLHQVCRIYTEVGECLLPWLVDHHPNIEVVCVLAVLSECVDLPLIEVSRIPLEFWHLLAREAKSFPQKFQHVFVDLLRIVIRRCAVPVEMDPFQADEFMDYRSQLLGTAQDCLEVISASSAVEVVLQSLKTRCGKNLHLQEAHLWILKAIAPHVQVCETSLLWGSIRSLPSLILQEVSVNESCESFMIFVKKTALKLVGDLWKWLRKDPNVLREALKAISSVLLVPNTAKCSTSSRQEDIQHVAAVALKDICTGAKLQLQESMFELCQLYTDTILLPTRTHVFVAIGVSSVVAFTTKDEDFEYGLRQLLTPLVAALQLEIEKPQLLAEILDRIIRVVMQIRVQQGSQRSVIVGCFVKEPLWPPVVHAMQRHTGDPKIAQKCCKLLRHLITSVPECFRQHVSDLVEVLAVAFSRHHQPSYLYLAEILANTYAKDPEIVVILAPLFHSLSGTAFQCLIGASFCLDEAGELVEGFYRLLERYLVHCPRIILEAPVLPHALRFCTNALGVLQQEVMEAVVGFIEVVYGIASEASHEAGQQQGQLGDFLKPHVMQVSAEIVQALVRVVAGTPTQFTLKMIPGVLQGIANACGQQQLNQWLDGSLAQLPTCVLSSSERAQVVCDLGGGEGTEAFAALQDLSFRLEQVAIRNRSTLK